MRDISDKWKNAMLSFFVINEGKEIQIECDDQGMSILVNALNKSKKAGHTHLRSRSNGGHELNEKSAWAGEEQAIGEVIITWAGD